MNNKKLKEGFISIVLFSFFLLCNQVSAQEYGSFTDSRDGKTYKTIKIGGQIWMAENLAFKTDTGSWACNNDIRNATTYGYLYNWETANNVCPATWHLPSNDEWLKLIYFLGGKTYSGGKLKAKILWKSPNTEASNSSGFTALPAGYYQYFSGNCVHLNESAVFWTSSDYDNDHSWNCFISYDAAIILNAFEIKKYGYSVRCVKSE